MAERRKKDGSFCSELRKQNRKEGKVRVGGGVSLLPWTMERR